VNPIPARSSLETLRSFLESWRRAYESRMAARTALAWLTATLCLWMSHNWLGELHDYEVAFLFGAFAAARPAAARSALWNFGEVKKDAWVGLSVVVLCLLLGPPAAWMRGQFGLPVGWLWVSLHAGSLAVVASRLTVVGLPAPISYLALGWVVPALAPGLSPILRPWSSDPSAHFPRWDLALASILTLVVVAQLLPAPTHTHSDRPE
jgi:hypothetical protein